MNKVLIISYYFPPAGGSAVQRVLKFVKYLPLNKWEPIVLTAKEADYSLKDESLCKDIPENIQVQRASAPDLYKLYTKIGKSKDTKSADLSAIGAGRTDKAGWLKKCALFIRNVFFIPDARIWWLPFALFAALKIIRRNRIKIIFATSPPFTTALVAGLLSRITGIPWVSDYRDPWTQAYFYFKRPAISRGYEEFLERTFLKSADRVISINQRILQGLKNKYGAWPAIKEAVIPNGYDPEDFDGLEPLRDKYFTVTYTGTVNSKMHPAGFLEAVKKFGSQNQDFKRNLRLNFIGRIGEDVKYMFEDNFLKENLNIISHLPHDECLRYTTGAELLLLLIPECEGNELIVTGKLFEYLYSGNPILCLSDKGEAAEIISNTNSGFTLQPYDAEAIRKVLGSCFQKWKKGKNFYKESVKQGNIERFNRKKSTALLAEVFNKLLTVKK